MKIRIKSLPKKQNGDIVNNTFGTNLKHRVRGVGMTPLETTDGFTGTVQYQKQKGLGLSRRMSEPVYNYFNNGVASNDTWKPASDYQKEWHNPPIPYIYDNGMSRNWLLNFIDINTKKTPFTMPSLTTIGSPVDRSLYNGVYSLPVVSTGQNAGIDNNYSESDSSPMIFNITGGSEPEEVVSAPYQYSYFMKGDQFKKSSTARASTNGVYATKWPTRDEAIRNGVLNGSSQQAFFEDMYHAVTNYLKDAGINENVGRELAYNIVAHKALESSSGGRLPGRFNYGGITADTLSGYADFNDIDDYVKGFFERTIGGKAVLAQALKGENIDLDKYMDILKKNGYYGADQKTYTNNVRENGYQRALRFLSGLGYPYQTGGKIHIKEQNRGRFTEAAQRAGKSVQAYAAQILANRDNYSPALVKRANFARNAASWKHQEGGAIKKYLEGNYVQPPTVDSAMQKWNDMLSQGFSRGGNIANMFGMWMGAASQAAAAIATDYGRNVEKGIFSTKNKSAEQSAEQNDANDIPIKENTGTLNISGSFINPYFITPPFTPKESTGGSTFANAEVERGEIISTPTGDSIVNKKAGYHRLFSDINETIKNQVGLTNNMKKDVIKNPQLSKLSSRLNKYTIARRGRDSFIFPATVGLKGILEPMDKKGFYPLADDINNYYV